MTGGGSQMEVGGWKVEDDYGWSTELHLFH